MSKHSTILRMINVDSQVYCPHCLQPNGVYPISPGYMRIRKELNKPEYTHVCRDCSTFFNEDGSSDRCPNPLLHRETRKS